MPPGHRRYQIDETEIPQAQEAVRLFTYPPARCTCAAGVTCAACQAFSRLPVSQQQRRAALERSATRTPRGRRARRTT